MVDLHYHAPEHLGPLHLGAWYVVEAIPPEEASAIIGEVEASGALEPTQNLPGRRVRQEFGRLAIDLTREHDFPHIAALAEKLAALAISEAGDTFPPLNGFSFTEAVVQVYKAGTELPLGWHKDGEDSKIVIASATLGGTGVVSLTDKPRYQDATIDDSVADIHTGPGGVLFIRGPGLYESEEDTRPAHAVTSIGAEADRFTVQFRSDVNAGQYGKSHVNADRPLRKNKDSSVPTTQGGHQDLDSN